MKSLIGSQVKNSKRINCFGRKLKDYNNEERAWNSCKYQGRDGRSVQKMHFDYLTNETTQGEAIVSTHYGQSMEAQEKSVLHS